MTHEEIIIKHLKEHGKLTSLVAMNRYRIMRLASRVSDLKKKGYPIISVTVTNPRSGKHWTEYRWNG